MITHAVNSPPDEDDQPVYIPKTARKSGEAISIDAIYVKRLVTSAYAKEYKRYDEVKGLVNNADRLWKALQKWAEWVAKGHFEEKPGGAVLEDVALLAGLLGSTQQCFIDIQSAIAHRDVEASVKSLAY
jgi:hypothetical protein